MKADVLSHHEFLISFLAHLVSAGQMQAQCGIWV